MANNDADHHSLLSSLIESPDQISKKPPVKYRRIRRVRSCPASEPLLNSNKLCDGASPGSKLFRKKRPSIKHFLLFLSVYLLVGCVCFYFAKDQLAGKRTNGLLDALYFTIVTMTTVGYGDLVPDSNLTKLLACAFVFSGMAIIAVFFSKAADYLVEKQEVLLYKTLHLHMHMNGNKEQMLRGIETNRVKYKLITSAVFLVILIFVGTLFLFKVEKLNLVDSFYCVCATITTLGYGDKSFSSEGGRVFAVFWILTSTICVAQFFFYLAELNSERRQKKLAKWVLHRRMTYVDLEAADLDGDNIVGAAEFILYKLKEMGKITQEDISIILEEFEDLDVDQSGTLSAYDLTLAMSNQQE